MGGQGFDYLRQGIGVPLSGESKPVPQDFGEARCVPEIGEGHESDAARPVPASLRARQ